MKRIYHPYNKWECYHNGLYNERNDEERDVRVNKSVILLKDTKNLDLFMSLVVGEWKHSCELYLSYKGYNRQAWLGQAACCYSHGATENETKEAWNKLLEYEMKAANEIADKNIKEWGRRYTS